MGKDIQSTNWTSKYSPYGVVYGRSPIIRLELDPLPTTHLFNGDLEERVKSIRRLHKQVQDIISCKMRSIKEVIISIEDMLGLRRIFSVVHL